MEKIIPNLFRHAKFSGDNGCDVARPFSLGFDIVESPLTLSIDTVTCQPVDVLGSSSQEDGLVIDSSHQTRILYIQIKSYGSFIDINEIVTKTQAGMSGPFHHSSFLTS